MRRRRDSGYAMMLAIMAMVLAGMALAVLGAAMNSMNNETRRQVADARRRNLQASAAAWADRASAAGRLKPGEKALPADTLAIPGAELKLTVDADGKTVRIDAACLLRRQTVRRSVTRKVP